MKRLHAPMCRGFATLLLLASLLPARSAFIAASNRVDMVHDATRNVLYISTVSNGVLRYSLASQSFLTPLPMIGQLRGLAISPDDRWLAAADAMRDGTNAWIHLADLQAGTNRRVLFPRGSGEGGTYSVAFGNDGALLETGTYEGSGWVVMRRYDPVTDSYTNIASPRQNSMLCASGDGSVIGYEESNISSGPVGRYDVAQQRITASSGTGAFNYEIAVDRRGRQFAALANTIYLFDANLGLMPQLRSNALGIAYSPVAEALFVSVPATNRIRVYDTGDGFFGLRGQFTTAQNLTGGGSAYGTGRLKLSRDGQRVFVTTPAGIEWFTNNLVLHAYDWVRIGGAPFRIGTPGPWGYGTNTVRRFTTVTNAVPAQAEAGDTRYRADGADVTAVPLLASATQVVVHVTNDVDITWRWLEHSYRVTLLAAGSGTVTGATNGWYLSNDTLTATAQPADGFRFARWLGPLPAAQQTSAVVTVSVDRPLTIEALFVATNVTPMSLAGEWPTYGRGPAHTGYFPGRLGNGLFTQKWSASLTGTLQQVAVGDGRVYVTPYQYFSSAWLAALDEQTGATLWHKPFTNCYSINPPTYDNGSVYVQRGDHATDTQLWKIDATNGATVWLGYHAAQWERYMAPCVADGGVWVNGGSYGGLYGFAQSNGQQRFFTALAQVADWTPAYANGRLFTHVGGLVREHQPLTGVAVATQAVQTGSSGTIALSGGAAFAAGATNLVAIDIDTHQARWSVAGSFSRTPAVANGIVYALKSTGVLAVTAGTGSFVGFYPMPSPTEQPIVTDDALIVCSASQTRIFDLNSFALLQTLSVGGLPSLANDTLFIARSTGQLIAYAAIPSIRVVVGNNTASPSAGEPAPLASGTNLVAQGTTVTTGVTSPWPVAAGTRLVSLGWTGTGAVPESGSETSVTFTASVDSTLSWLWETNHFLTVNQPANGSLAPTSTWQLAGSTVGLTAIPAPHYHFVAWTGAATGTAGTADVLMAGPRAVSAVFAPDLLASNVPAWWLARYGLPTDDTGVYGDNDADRLPNWLEYQEGTDPLRRDTDGDGAWDSHEVIYAADPTNRAIRPLDNRQPDYDGDGITDIALRQTRGRLVEVRRSSDGTTLRWQTSTRLSRVVVGDFDGDGITDLADFTPATGQWRIDPSSTPGASHKVGWGWKETIPVPADYDGDGRTDLAVYHPAAGNWHVLRSHDNSGAIRNWGWSNAIPVPADYDGDHGADFAVYDPASGNWHLRFSSTGSNAIVAWGWSEAVPLPGDYDGDGLADLAVYHARLATWHILGSETGEPRQQQWGASGIIPAPGDFDGDGGTDLTYYNPANRTTYVLPAAGTPWWLQWGRNGYEPVNSQFLINRAMGR